MDYSLLIEAIIWILVPAAVIIGGCLFAYKKWNFKEPQTGWKKWVKRGLKVLMICTAAYVLVYAVIIVGLSIELYRAEKELAKIRQMHQELGLETIEKEDLSEEKQWYLDIVEDNLDVVADSQIIVDIDDIQDAIDSVETEKAEAAAREDGESGGSEGSGSGSAVLSEADGGSTGSTEFLESELNRTILRERPVLSGESLWSIAEDVYGDPYKWRLLYEVNKDMIGDNPSLIYKGQYLIIPEDDSRSYTDYEYCYQETVAAAFDWEGTPEYIDPECGYDILNCVFYYTLPEGDGEIFRICYPRLISHNGKDVSAVNAGIRECALKYADQMLINRTDELTYSLKTDERYDISWVRSEVNYRITYLDENTISVVFQDYLFVGSILGEDMELRAYVADINTGKQYKIEELLHDLDDRKIAEAIHADLLLQNEGDDSVLEVVEKVLTPELICDALKTNGSIDNRHFINIFLTKDGVGFAFSYRVGQEIDGNYRIMRGWRKTILPTDQVAPYQTDAVIWKYHSGED